MKVFEGWDVSVATKPFYFGADLDHDPDPGSFSRNFYHFSVVRILLDQWHWQRFALSEYNNSFSM